MSMLLTLVVASALLTWLLIIVASLVRSGGPTPEGVRLALGNRDDMPAPSALAGRAQRTAANQMENFVIFAALAIVAEVAGRGTGLATQGAWVFFLARVVYAAVYLAGIPVLRTLVWLVSLVGMGMILAALL